MGEENEIAILVDEESARGRAGSYEFEFSAIGGSASGGDAWDLPSGIYFYKLQAGDPSASAGQSFIETKKLIYLN